ncbi:MAG: extracellular solute-binding protein [Planctomycetes bacterium]|nr:extracellular solute-binding protein [Planctomycetota bacterium]
MALRFSRSFVSAVLAVVFAGGFAGSAERRFDHLGWKDEVYCAQRRLQFLEKLVRDDAKRRSFMADAIAVFDPEQPDAARAAFEAFREKWSDGEPQAVAALEADFEDIRKYLYAEVLIKPWWYDPQPLNDIDQAKNLPYIKYMAKHPNVRIEAFSPLEVPGGAYQAAILMSIAARNSPEILGLFIHMTRKFADQNLISPLNEYVGYDDDGNGLVDNHEAIWEPWKSIPDSIKVTCMKDGNVYAIPNGSYPGPIVLIYRRDLFDEAGLDPNKPPRNWEEFLDVSRRLTRPHLKIQGAKLQMGRRGFFIYNGAFMWYPWFWAAGGDLVVQLRTCANCGTANSWLKEETEFKCANCGKPVFRDKQDNRIKSEWRATFADDAGAHALRLYQKLRWQLWIRCTECDKPIVLDRGAVGPALKKLEPEDHAGSVQCPARNANANYKKQDVTEGTCRIFNDTQNVSRVEAFENGEVAMMMWYLWPEELGELSLRPEQIGVCPVPVRTPQDKPFAVAQPSFSAMAAEIDSQAKKDATWDLIAARFAYSDDVSRAYAWAGYYKFMSPAELKGAGLDDFLAELPDWWIDNLNTAYENTRTEPFQKNATYIQDQVFHRNVFDKVFQDPDLDVVSALKAAQKEANTKFLSGAHSEKIRKYRPLGFVAVIVGGGVFLGLLALYIRTAARHYKAEGLSGMSEKKRLVAPLLLLAPAVISIALWSYYPLVRGSLMAFQDYRVLGGTTWVGIDNFLKALLDPNFYVVMSNTFLYVALSLSMGFIAPIVLAILLTEVPVGKYFFRTVFYLPAVMSPLVVMFLWKLMYNESEYGFLNQIVMSARVFEMLWWAVTFLGGAFVLVAASNMLRKQPRPVAGILYGIVGLIFLLPALGELFPHAFLLRYCRLLPWEKPVGWLTEKTYAMPAVILPFVWAGAGPGCLIYLAALKSVPEDLYEAADVDGAGIWSKLWRITIPTLKPLIIINFVGATIGAFQSMQNILVMTGGGAGTNVIGLQIWKEAYIFLNFGYATALAWILGSMLIGFTVMQLNVLRKVEFHKAAEN